MDKIAGLLNETARVDNAKKDPYRVFFVKDRSFYFPDTDLDGININKSISHGDIKALYVIKPKKSGPEMVEITVDEYLNKFVK